MRRAFRHAFTLLSALSLLLCVAVCVMWVRGYRFYHVGETYAFRMRSVDGRLKVAWAAMTPGERSFYDGELTGLVEATDQGGGFGFGIATRSDFDDDEPRTARLNWMAVTLVPYWFVAAATTLIPAVWTCRFVKAAAKTRRRDNGLCPACGYDLRASARRCPECGRAAGPRAQTSTV